MSSGALFLLPIASALVVTIARFVELGTRRNVIPGRVRETLTLRLFVVIGLGVLLSSIAEYVLSGRGISWPLFAGGWLVALLSFWLRRRAIAALGRFWSLHVEIRDEHELVTGGPFRYVRHPAYLSMILELTALALLCNARFSLLFALLAFPPVMFLRIYLEEGALVEKFGTAYSRYQSHTPALIPRPW